MGLLGTLIQAITQWLTAVSTDYPKFCGITSYHCLPTQLPGVRFFESELALTMCPGDLGWVSLSVATETTGLSCTQPVNAYLPCSGFTEWCVFVVCLFRLCWRMNSGSA
jgi:hypothetical protein